MILVKDQTGQLFQKRNKSFLTRWTSSCDETVLVVLLLQVPQL